MRVPGNFTASHRFLHHPSRKRRIGLSLSSMPVTFVCISSKNIIGKNSEFPGWHAKNRIPREKNVLIKRISPLLLTFR
jgi:hypothetical protein